MKSIEEIRERERRRQLGLPDPPVKVSSGIGDAVKPGNGNGDHGGDAKVLAFNRKAAELLDESLHERAIDALKTELDEIIPAPDIDQLQDEKPHLSDTGNAERMCRRYGSKLHFIKHTHQWLVWNGRIWSPDADALLNRYARRVVRAIYAEAADETDRADKEKLLRHAIASEADSRVTAMLHLLRWMDNGKLGIEIPIDYNRLDADAYALNVANGTLDLRTGELQKHDKEDLITKLSPVEYDATAKSEPWETFLDTVTDGDADLRSYLQRAAGYSLLANNESEKLFYILGGTASGKSTFISAVLSVLGDYGAVADVTTFLQQKHQSLSPRDDLARLAGARMISVGETPEGARLQTALVKQWCGGDQVVARRLYGKHFEFRPGVVWLHANHRARVPADEAALFRRLRVIPFKHSIPEDKQDPAIKRDLSNMKLTGKAILAWLVQGALAYQREGLGDPQAVRQANLEYKEDMNPCSQWVSERCEIDPGNANLWEPTKDLYSDYLSYCSENGIKHTLSTRSFGRALAAMGLEAKSWGHSNTRGWSGVRLTAGNPTGNPETFLNGDNDSLPENSDPSENVQSVEIGEVQGDNDDLPF